MAISIYLHGSSTIFPISSDSISSVLVSNTESLSNGVTATNNAATEDIKSRVYN